MPDQPAPYPLLVTIGDGDDGQTWLLNIEDMVLHLTGDRTYAADYARYLAAEIACHPWSAGVRLDCLGAGEEIGPMNPDRVRVRTGQDDPIPEVIADAVTMVDRAAAVDAPVATVRASQLGADSWPARALLIDADPGRGPALAQLLDLVQEHPERTGTAVIVNGAVPEAPGATLRFSSSGRVSMPAAGLDLVAVGLTSDEAHGCAALAAQADDLEGIPIPVDTEAVRGWRAWSDQAGALRSEYTLRRDTDLDDVAEPATSILDAADEEYLRLGATTSQDLDALAPKVTDTVRRGIEEADPTLDRDVVAWFSDRCPFPRLTLLGPVVARTHGVAVTKRKAYWTEVLAYLATHPDGVTAEELAEAFSITPIKAREYARTVREWLGANPRTGEKHLPDAREAPGARDNGVGVYQVLDVLVDADLFRRLRARGEARGPDGIADLKTALTLVTGRPFDRLRPGGWVWLYEGDRIDQHMICAIVDVAHIVTTHSLHAEDLKAARHAAETAARSAPDEETPRLDLAAVASAEGHHVEADGILRNDVCNRSDDDGAPPGVPERTENILRAHDWPDRGQAAS